MIELLERVRQAVQRHGDLAITSETVSDALMQYNSHALGLELIEGITRYPRPEIYTYTFPEHARQTRLSAKVNQSRLVLRVPPLAGEVGTIILRQVKTGD
jgi:hypothetical protein